MKHRTPFLLPMFAILALLAITPPVHAADVNAFWTGGTGNWNNINNWLDNIVPNNGADSFSVFIDDGSATASSVALDLDAYITNLTIDADDALTINNGRRLRVVAGTIDNAGTLSLGSTGANTYLHPRGGVVTLTGGGTLALSNTDTNWIYQEAGGSLVNVNNTIRGSGNLGFTGAPTNIDNQGTIVADQSTALVIQSGTGVTFTNTGMLRAENGATLLFSTANVDNTDGVIEALDNSHVSISSSTIAGGTFQTSGTGAIETQNTNAVIDATGQTVNNMGTLRILNGDFLYAVGTINNTGTIDIASTGANTILYPSGGPLTLTGGGTLTMGMGGTAWIRQASSGSLINVDNTIRGSGNLGYTGTPLNVDNQGSVIADQGAPLVIQSGTGVTFTNTGTLRAENGATLLFSSANVDNTDGVIEALDTSRVSISSSTIAGGTLRTSGTGAIETENTSTAINGTAQTVNNMGTLRILNGDALYAVGTINNTGAIEIASTGANSYLYANGGPLTLTGGGTFSMGTGAAAWVRQNAGGSLINIDNTIHGSGNLGYTGTPLNIDNQGTVVADQASPLTIQGGTGVTFTNTGIVRAENNATLAFQSAAVNNAGGVIEALTGSNVTLASTVITGGTLQTTGTGTISSADNSSVLVDLTNAAQFRVPNGDRISLAGTIHNTGSIMLESSAANTYCFVTQAPVTLTGGGTVAMSDHGNNWLYQQGNGSLVNVDNTIRGSGHLGYTGGPTNITNQALIVADQPTPMVIQSGTGVSLTNTGTIRAENGGTCAFDTATVANAGGVIEALDGSVVTLDSTSITGGTLQTSGSGYVISVNPSTSLIDVASTGDLRIQNGDRIYLSGTITNSGTIQLNSTGANTYLFLSSDPVTLTGGGTIEMTNSGNNWIYQQNNGSLVNVNNTIRGAGNLGYSSGPTDITNQGMVIADQPVQLICGGGSALFDNQGNMTANGAGGLRIRGVFQTSGTVSVNAASVLNREGTYTQTAGSTIVNGILNASGDVNILGGSLGGTGTVNDGVTNAGTVAPGNSIGTLTIDDTYAQTVDGELYIEIDAMTQDQLVVTGAATLAGGLRLDFAHDPAIGESYDIMTYANHTGEFDAFDTPCLPGGKSVYVAYSDTAVIVTIGASLDADVDCDCAVTTVDIEKFTLALLDTAAYESATPNCNGIEAVDYNNDGLVDGRDIQGFVTAWAQ
ncbi:MAG: hypothetical protein H6818_22295 [Phycisphaerales bacterium]|nr:hypothetical protein [Phycisphaerales bacterium]